MKFSFVDSAELVVVETCSLSSKLTYIWNGANPPNKLKRYTIIENCDKIT